MTLLSNKVAIVTGASSGIGRTTAALFAREGANVVIGARREDQLNSLVHEIRSTGGQAVALAGDVTSEDYNKSLVELALSEFGQLNVAFNNAGMLGDAHAVTELRLVDWNQLIQTNLTSGFLAAKHQIPAMHPHGGSIIFTSSFVGNGIGMPNKCAYAASKAGLVGLTQSLATEYGPQNIRLNAVLPGGTETPMLNEFGATPEVLEFVNQIHALKRIARPDEIAQAVLFLASDASSFVTGSAMLVDGGVSICKT